MPKVLRITTFLVKPTFHVEMRYQTFTGTLCKQFFLLSQKVSLTLIELECNFICSEAREVFSNGGKSSFSSIVKFRYLYNALDIKVAVVLKDHWAEYFHSKSCFFR